MKSPVFWDITQYSPLNVNWRFGGACNLHLHGEADNKHITALLVTCFTLISCLGYFSMLKILTCSSETSIDSQRPIRYHIPKDRTFSLVCMSHGFIDRISVLLRLHINSYGESRQNASGLLVWGPSPLPSRDSSHEDGLTCVSRLGILSCSIKQYTVRSIGEWMYGSIHS